MEKFHDGTIGFLVFRDLASEIIKVLEALFRKSHGKGGRLPG